MLKSAPANSIGGYIELDHVIGTGGFSKVYLGYDKKRKISVAVKTISKALVKLHGIEAYVEREIEMMHKLDNPHVVKIIDAIESTRFYNIVMELAGGGELFDKIVDSKRFDEKTARNYFQQLISAVHYCHKRNIVHRDLKAENLLLAADNSLKVCDFGLSRYTKEVCASDTDVLFRSLAGSIDYQAPEVLKERGYEGSSCDMWSCGVILFFMLCGYLPFADENDNLTRKRILSCHYNRTNRYLSPEASDLISHLLERNPQKRYTTTDVIAHPWFQINLNPELFPTENVESVTPVESKSVIQRIGTPPAPGDRKASDYNKITELYHAFENCNVAGDGFLDHEEVRDALIKLKGEQPVSEEEVNKFMSNFKLDSEGRITPDEFLNGWVKNENKLNDYSIEKMTHLFDFKLEKESMPEIRKAFDQLDVDKTGLITKESLEKLGKGLQASELADLMKAMGPENDGKTSVTFERFVRLIMNYDSLKNLPLTIQLRGLEEFFELTEHQYYGRHLGKGFTVYGKPPETKELLISKKTELSTEFTRGARSELLSGCYFQKEKKVLVVMIKLQPCMQDYTRLGVQRIAGPTMVFHSWFLNLRKALKNELLRFEADLAVKGEPELM